jgi:hypothetical protein
VFSRSSEHGTTAETLHCFAPSDYAIDLGKLWEEEGDGKRYTCSKYRLLLGLRMLRVLMLMAVPLA